MKIVIGDYTDPDDSRNLILNDEVRDSNGNLLSRCFGYIQKVEGLETAPYRNGTGDWSGTDGGYMSSQLYSAREIVISGFYNDKMSWCDPAVFNNGDNFDHYARLYIRSRLPIRTKLSFRIFLDSGLTFYTEGYCTDLKMDYDKVDEGEFQITFYCPDPALYLGASDGELGAESLTSTLYKEKDVGYVMPYELPVTWSTGGRSAPVEYGGDFPYAPQIIVRGPLVNPSFTLLETGQTFKLGYSSDTSCVVKVDGTEGAGSVESVGEVLATGVYGPNYRPSEHPLGGKGTGLTISYKTGGKGGRGYGVDANRGLSIQNRGTGYAVGDLLEVVFESVQDSYIPSYLLVESVNSDGGLVSWKMQSIGDYKKALTGATCTLRSVVGSGSGATATGNTVAWDDPTAGFIWTVDRIVDGGQGYSVGDIIYMVPDMSAGYEFYPADTITTFTVGSTTGNGAITSLSIVDPGEYEMDCSAEDITLISATGEEGSGALLKVEMTQNENTKLWSVSKVTVTAGGQNYVENAEYIPQVWASTTLRISASQTLTIDMDAHTVTVDGVSRSHYIHPNSEWFSLQANKTNHIIFTSQGIDDNSTATVQWKDAYQGI